jgi:hypothetical protein
LSGFEKSPTIYLKLNFVQLNKLKIMTKIAIVVFADTITMESVGKLSNAFVLANEAIENGDDLKFIFEGAGTKWIGELEKEDHMLHKMYLGIKNHITGVCAYCAKAFGVKNEVEKSGLQLLDEYKNHPSLRNLFVEGYNVLTV